MKTSEKFQNALTNQETIPVVFFGVSTEKMMRNTEITVDLSPKFPQAWNGV